MAAFPHRVTLGRTGLQVSPLAVAGGYDVDAASLRRAFDRGVNYWYHGSLRRDGMAGAIRDLVAAGRRDELVIVLQSYSRWPWLMERTLGAGLKGLGIDHCDVLLLGWHNRLPSRALLERAEALRARGWIRHLAISSHHRPAFVDFAADSRFGILHIRYNAAHPGAEQDVFPHVEAANRPGIVDYTATSSGQLIRPGRMPESEAPLRARDGYRFVLYPPGIVGYTATSWGQLIRPGRMPKGEAPLRARDCYRFVLSNPDFQVCMTGPADAAQMDEALTALDEGPLSPEEMERARRLGRHVAGK